MGQKPWQTVAALSPEATPGVPVGSKPPKARTASSNPEVCAVLIALGDRVRQARMVRDIQLREMSDRLGLQVRTLSRLEKGAPGVAMETLGLVLWYMNLLDHLDRICADGTDPEGERLLARWAPRRLRSGRGRKIVNRGWLTLGKL